MRIYGNVEKNEQGQNEIMIWLTATESKILDLCIQNFDKYDKRDLKYMAKVNELKTEIHKARGLLNPS